MRRPSSSTNITSRHGDPVAGSTYGKHLGTDYALPLNSPIVAPVAGVIATQGWSNSVGNYIEINGDDGRAHRLLHLNQRQVNNGVRVAEGQHLGLSGSTGSSSTGPHIHWDARKGGTAFGDGYQNFVDTEKLVTDQAPPPPTQTGSSYIVVANDTLSGIGAKTGTDWKEIARINGIPAPYTIYPGQVLKLPGSGGSTAPAPPKTYTVKPNDTMSGIAAATQQSLSSLAAKNPQIKDLNKIYPGQVINI